MCECGKKTCGNCEGTPESKQRVPHKHAAFIKAWADGAQIECKGNDGIWYPRHLPCWDSKEYRVKPEPKPDAVITRAYRYNTKAESMLRDMAMKHNVQFTFDGETGVLKSVELVK